MTRLAIGGVQQVDGGDLLAAVAAMDETGLGYALIRVPSLAEAGGHA